MIHVTSICPHCKAYLRRKTNPAHEVDVPFEKCWSCGNVYTNNYKEEWITKSPLKRFFFYLQAPVWARALLIPLVVVGPLFGALNLVELIFPLYMIGTISWLTAGYFIHRNSEKDAIKKSIERTENPEYVDLLKKAGYKIYPLDKSNVMPSLNVDNEAEKENKYASRILNELHEERQNDTCENRETKIKCPTCSKEGKAEFWSDIDVLENTALKAKVLDSSLFSTKCEGCGKPIKLEYNCFYHDADKKIIVCSVVDGNCEDVERKIKPYESQEYRIRIVDSNIRLHEKVNIFEFELRDTVIESLKIYLSFHIGTSEAEQLYIMKNLFFTSMGENGEGKKVLNFCYHNKNIQCDKEMYDSALSEIPGELFDEQGRTNRKIDVDSLTKYFAEKEKTKGN